MDTAADPEATRRIEVDPDQVSGGRARIPAGAFSVHGRQSTSTGRLAAARRGGGWLIDGIG